MPTQLAKLDKLALEHGPASSGINLRTMVLHASATVAQTHVDHLDNRMGAALLAAIRPAEFSIFLRYWKHPHRRSLVAGKPADVFIAGLPISLVLNALPPRSLQPPSP